MWAHKQFVTRVRTVFYFSHDITNPWMAIKTTIFTYRQRVSLVQFVFCWWRHNRLLMKSQWPDYCDAMTWILISNSLVINFIHGDIHDRSCKKYTFHLHPYLKISSAHTGQRNRVHSNSAWIKKWLCTSKSSNNWVWGEFAALDILYCQI